MATVPAQTHLGDNPIVRVGEEIFVPARNLLA